MTAHPPPPQKSLTLQRAKSPFQRPHLGALADHKPKPAAVQNVLIPTTYKIQHIDMKKI